MKQGKLKKDEEVTEGVCFVQSGRPRKADVPEKNGVGRPVPLEADEFQGGTTTEGRSSTTATKTMTGKFENFCPTENLAQFRCKYRMGYRGGSNSVFI